MLRNTLIALADSSAARTVVTRSPLRGLSRRFVPGERVDDLMAAARQAHAEGMPFIANFLGESVKTEASAREAARVYRDIIDRLSTSDLDGIVSVKFTQLGQAISERFLAENLTPLLERAREEDVFVRFDMESSEYVQRTLDAFEKLWADGWRNIGVVLQSYLRRTAGDVARMNDLGARVRLCKGAYAEPPSVAFQEKEAVDRSFVELTETLLTRGTFPAIATHDERMIEATLDIVRREGLRADDFEFQMLHGVRRDLQRQLVADGWRMRVYIPFGSHWYPYLMRRLAERPANMVFMAGSVVKESPLGFLWPAGDRG